MRDGPTAKNLRLAFLDAQVAREFADEKITALFGKLPKLRGSPFGGIITYNLNGAKRLNG